MQATKFQTFEETLAAELELSLYAFGRHAHLAGWTADRFRAEMQRDGWRERFFAEVEAAVEPTAERAATKKLGELLAGGAAALARFPFTARVALVDAKVRKTALDYDPHRDGSRLLCGPTAAGKTAAAVCVAERVVRVHELQRLRAGLAGRIGNNVTPLCWTSASALPVARLQQGLGDGEAPAVQAAIDATCLVLDDLGWESARAGADGVIAEVVAARYDAGRPTLTTTGLRPEQAVERYGDAFVRRLTECGGKTGGVVDVWGSR